MSGGRWVRQENGDYQHYTDEEYAKEQHEKFLVTLWSIVLVFPLAGYFIVNSEEFVFGDFHNFPFILICLFAIVILVCVFCMFRNSTIVDVVLSLIIIGVIDGLLIYGYRSLFGNKDAQEDIKTEMVSCPNCGNNITFKLETKSKEVNAHTEKCSDCGSFVKCNYSVIENDSVRIDGVSVLE